MEWTKIGGLGEETRRGSNMERAKSVKILSDDGKVSESLSIYDIDN